MLSIEFCIAHNDFQSIADENLVIISDVDLKKDYFTNLEWTQINFNRILCEKPDLARKKLTFSSKIKNNRDFDQNYFHWEVCFVFFCHFFLENCPEKVEKTYEKNV